MQTDSSKISRNRCSPKSYAIAVSLSGVFGFIGVQHFYLGRHIEGMVDLWLTVAWVYFFFIGDHVWLGLLALALDLAHSLVVTIMLLTGSFKDSEGRIVCYPGQELG